MFKRPRKAIGVPLRQATLTLAVNLLCAVTFALVYYCTDDKKVSRLRGISDTSNMTSYLYFSVIIQSTLGLGEIVPHTDEKGAPSSFVRFLVATQVMVSLWLNDFLDSYENMIWG